MLDVAKGELVEPGDLLIEGERIVEVGPTSVPDDAVVVDLGDLTLLPGLMDMEVNLLMGGPDHTSPLVPVQDDPAVKTLRAVANAISGGDVAFRVEARASPELFAACSGHSSRRVSAWQRRRDAGTGDSFPSHSAAGRSLP